MEKFTEDFTRRFPELAGTLADIEDAARLIIQAFSNDNFLYLCGNGGSAADCEHIAGELLKSFVCKRPLPAELKQKLKDVDKDGEELGKKLECGLRTIALTSHLSFATAFANDVDPSMIYAQQLLALGREGDVLLGISTSGNADNIRKSFITAKAVGIKTILLTGKSGGKCAKLADCVIRVPETETYLVQEKHLAIYHTLCLIIEDYFYGK